MSACCELKEQAQSVIMRWVVTSCTTEQPINLTGATMLTFIRLPDGTTSSVTTFVTDAVNGVCDCTLPHLTQIGTYEFELQINLPSGLQTRGPKRERYVDEIIQ